jgi:mono/diheme cytochrome c family protein
MSKVSLKDEEAEALTTYLLSLRGANLTERLTPRDKYEERHRAFSPAALSGEELYRQYCFACHGEGVETVLHDTLRVAIPAIQNPDFLAVVSEDFLLRNIRDGRPGTPMPAWGRHGGGLSDDEIRRLALYLLAKRTESREVRFVVNPTTDPVNGKRLFEKHCSTCHSVTQAGGESSWLGSPGFQQTYSDALIGYTTKFGRSGTLMNPYGKQEGGDLTDAEISDVIRFVRTLR